ncbi:hypothetical protein JWG39_03895 [Desulforhopalus vacuolatus]|uniref:hypothetical protein n=1 Tax=Desulforhopalus vacuolatus TaxID=40414 RepID=UPI001963EE18|nr:hypothetical protein [Desulforhopalus vacuolatus]MBM9518956.1 hypothetical protein [Desulforhopalus vacuolatus]
MTKSDRTMMQKMGIWIDHKEAVLVSLQNGQTTVERIESNAESHFRPSGGWKSSGTNVAQSVSKEQTADERRKHQFRNFYQEVIEQVRNASLLYIFGPGEAKGELVKEIEKIKGQPERIAAVEVCDSLTENQLVAQVKSFFAAA